MGSTPLDSTRSGQPGPHTRLRSTGIAATSRCTGRRGGLRSLAPIGAALIVALAAAAATRVAGDSRPTHDVKLVARDMAFYLEGGARPNPEIAVPAGQAIRLVMVNRDAGIDHDLAIASLGVAAATIPGDGSSTEVAFRAPREPGEHEYVCSLHGRMMRGRLIVR